MYLKYLIIFILSFFGLLSCSELDKEPTQPDLMDISSDTPVPFPFQNYLGNTQNIHPKVLYFREGWNGYKFWMAYTPYPGGEISAENPSIAVSNDGVNWTEPANLKNPLIGTPIVGYNSDTHLVFDESNNILECWWREVNESIQVDRIKRTNSKDGIEWTMPEEIFSDGESMMHLSPAVSIVGGTYYMFYCDAKNIILMRSGGECKSLKWEKETILPVEWNDLHPWHLDVVIEENNIAEIIVCAFTSGCNNNSADLYYIIYDLISDECTEPQLILSRSENFKDIHSRSIYRSSLLKINEINYVYFSCIDKYWQRYMSLAYGDDITNLKFHSLSHSIIF